MARLFFNIWPLASKKTCPMAYNICQSSSIFCQIVNKVSKTAQDFEDFAKKRNFVKCSHTACVVAVVVVGLSLKGSALTDCIFLIYNQTFDLSLPSTKCSIEKMIPCPVIYETKLTYSRRRPESNLL